MGTSDVWCFECRKNVPREAMTHLNSRPSKIGNQPIRRRMCESCKNRILEAREALRKSPAPC